MTTSSNNTNLRNHPYTFEQALQHSSDYTPPQVTRHQRTGYFTWLVFMEVKWVPFDANNQYKLEQTLNLGGTFVDIQDSHFPGVKRVRAFPKSNYISYLGVKYRLSRVMQPDAWIEPPDHENNRNTTHSSSLSSTAPTSQPPSLSLSNSMNRVLPAPSTFITMDNNNSNLDSHFNSNNKSNTGNNSNNNNSGNNNNTSRLSHSYQSLARPVFSRVS
ncbi:hypothetical protein BDC45DRAFT_519212 [Circinella umbellata]|nr:hypothetical protein BDC45DRAFT_519212 [Circinella umbellata]